MVNRLARALSGLVRPHDPIAIHADLSLNGVLLVLASMKLGLKAALCPLKEPLAVLNAWFQDVGISQMLSSGDHKGTSEFDIEVCDIEDLWQMACDDEPLSDCSEHFLSFLRTSGTTSTPKTAVIDYRAHCASALAVNAYFGFDEHETWALSLPLYHVSGLSIIVRAVLANAHIYLAADYHELKAALSLGAISHCSLVPSQLKRLLDDDVDLCKLRAVIVGGDRLQPADRDRALLRAWPLFETYGLCETASMVAVTKSGEDTKTTVLSHADIRLDETREILVKAESLLVGYLSKGKLINALTPDGYLRTGDISASDEISALDVICRKNNRIISGGENIQAEEVESVLEQHPLIDECVVVAQPDERMGFRPLAFIKWHKDPLSPEQIKEFLRPRLAAYKWPTLCLPYPATTPQSLKKPRRWLNDHSAMLKI